MKSKLTEPDIVVLFVFEWLIVKKYLEEQREKKDYKDLLLYAMGIFCRYVLINILVIIFMLATNETIICTDFKN